MAIADIQIKSIQQGSEAAFEQVFKAYYSPLCQYAHTLLKDMDEAEEVVQGVFHSFWEKKNQLDIQISLKAYLYKMVYNLCLNRLKHSKIKDAYMNYNAAQIKHNPSFASDLADANELKIKIEEAIESLPEQCRLIFRLSRFEELKYAEIASQLGISIKTVENQMGKALKVLRLKLADYLVLWLILCVF